MKTNKQIPIFTHEGAKASKIDAYHQLRRSVMSCLLWEKEFYEDGQEISERIKFLSGQVDSVAVEDMAIETRCRMNLRHVSLWLLIALAEQRKLRRETVFNVINRADEMAELISLWWKSGKRKLPMAIKKGITDSFCKFDEYQLAKYDRNDAVIKLRDVMFLCHPKPDTPERELLYKKIADNKLETPDTWEVSMSAGKDKKESWERLLSEKKLGGLALLRNLRNMEQSSVSQELIVKAIAGMKTDKILPFRFIAAARYAPKLEYEIERALFRAIADHKRLAGKTIVLVDVSGSMDYKLSEKSDMTRIDAACGVAMISREICDSCDVYTFSNSLICVPARHGFALRDAIANSQCHSGTYLGSALSNLPGYDRLIVITDEQSHDSVGNPKGKGYMINVASAKNGVGYHGWTHIDGFSEAVLNYIVELETAL